MMGTTKTNFEFAEMALRFDKMIYLTTSLIDSYSLPDDLEELLGDSTMSELKEIFGDQLIQQIDDEEPSAETVAEWLIENWKFGFLVEAATPVRKFMNGTQSNSFSWGYFYTKWIYAPTLDEAIEKAKQWAVEMVKKDKDESIKAKGGAA